MSLYLEDTNLYINQLDREYHHNYQAFSIDESIKQQNEYKKLLENIRKLKNTKTYEIKMDDFIEAYKINEIFHIKIKKIWG